MFLNRKKKQYADRLLEEQEHWERRQTDPELIAAKEREQEATRILGLNEDKLSIVEYLTSKNLRFKTGLSLGCGEGRAERHFIEKGICERFDAIDVAEDSLKRAGELAANQGLKISYHCMDLNTCELKGDEYDIVIAQSVLHHVENLEHLALEISKSLKHDGLLWITDYIGESRLQYSDKRLEIANRILELLPEQLRYNRLREPAKYVNKIRRPKEERLSPFEAIRSSEIMQVFSGPFEIVEKHESNTIAQLLMRHGFRDNYLQIPNGKAICKLIRLIDRLLLEEGVLSPMSGQYIMKRKQ